MARMYEPETPWDTAMRAARAAAPHEPAPTAKPRQPLPRPLTAEERDRIAGDTALKARLDEMLAEAVAKIPDMMLAVGRVVPHEYHDPELRGVDAQTLTTSFVFPLGLDLPPDVSATDVHDVLCAVKGEHLSSWLRTQLRPVSTWLYAYAYVGVAHETLVVCGIWRGGESDDGRRTPDHCKGERGLFGDGNDFSDW